VRVFFHFDFHIYAVGVGDTILYDPARQAMLAYKGRRYFLVNVQNNDGVGVRNWAIGLPMSRVGKAPGGTPKTGGWKGTPLLRVQ
jgi:hypothetical protein